MTPFPDEFESSIQSRVAYEDYAAVPAVSITRLKELRRSAQHYRYALTHPKETDPLRLGTASHVATLEPERFASQFAVWDRQTSAAACDAAAAAGDAAWAAQVAELRRLCECVDAGVDPYPEEAL
jgi:hypothetical protein